MDGIGNVSVEMGRLEGGGGGMGFLKLQRTIFRNHYSKQ